MTDPAVEAAQQVSERHNWDGMMLVAADAGAHEVLRPIREKIRELQTDIPTDDPKFGEGVDYAIAELAPLIYLTEELER